MKPKILFLLFLLVAGCTKPVNQTPIETEIVTTKVLLTITPTTTLEVLPTESLETPAVEVAAAYPPVSPTQFLTNDAYPAPAFGPTQTPYPSPTPTATPEPEQRLDAAKSSWESCREKWSSRGSDIPVNKDLAGLVFYYGRSQQGTPGEWDSIWKYDEQGRPIFIACPEIRSFEVKNNRMLFQHDNDFWLANLQNGSVEQVSDSPDLMPYFAAWSSDGRYVYYDKYDPSMMRAADIWVYDSQKRENHQATFSPGIGKVQVIAWPGHPEWFFYVALLNGPGPGIGDSFLINVAGATNEYIGNQPLPGLPSFSPDGHTVAFAGENKISLIQFNQAPKVIPYGQFKAGKWTIRGGSNPDWSPDGKRIALGGTAWNETGDFTGLIVLDPVTKNASFLHPFTPIGRGGSVLPYQWSSDNQWLSLIADDENQAKAGLWILRADGSKEQYIRSASSSYWSPQGYRLLYYGGPANPGYWLLDIKTMKSTPLNFPEQMGIIRWDHP